MYLIVYKEVHMFIYVGTIRWNENVLTYPDVIQFGQNACFGNKMSQVRVLSSGPVVMIMRLIAR